MKKENLKNTRQGRLPKDNAQKYGVDYDETFSLVARMDTIRVVLAIEAQNQWPIYQMDVKSVFLSGILEEEFYV